MPLNDVGRGYWSLNFLLNNYPDVFKILPHIQKSVKAKYGPFCAVLVRHGQKLPPDRRKSRK